MPKSVKDQNAFVKFAGVVETRHGAKPPWIEIVITKPNGERVKLIARKVARFYSETERAEGNPLS